MSPGGPRIVTNGHRAASRAGWIPTRAAIIGYQTSWPGRRVTSTKAAMIGPSRGEIADGTADAAGIALIDKNGGYARAHLKRSLKKRT